MIDEGKNFNIEKKTRKISKKRIFSGNKKSFCGYFKNLYYDSFVLVSINQKLSNFTIFPYFLRFYWLKRTVSTLIICEYFEFFQFVSLPHSFYSDGRGEGIIIGIISILMGIISSLRVL